MWITKETDSVWVEIEQNSCQNIPLESLPFLTEITQKKLNIGKEWIKGTMKVWAVVRKKSKL